MQEVHAVRRSQRDRRRREASRRDDRHHMRVVVAPGPDDLLHRIVADAHAVQLALHDGAEPTQLGENIAALVALPAAVHDGPPGALELAGNLPSFDDLVVHPTINVDELDPQCAIDGLVLNTPRKVAKVDAILSVGGGSVLDSAKAIAAACPV